jgi:hypothetical protein
MHTGKELEVHQVEKGRLSCDSDAPNVGSARSDWTKVVIVNRRKTRPCCIYVCVCVCVCIIELFEKYFNNTLTINCQKSLQVVPALYN